MRYLFLFISPVISSKKPSLYLFTPFSVNNFSFINVTASTAKESFSSHLVRINKKNFQFLGIFFEYRGILGNTSYQQCIFLQFKAFGKRAGCQTDGAALEAWRIMIVHFDFFRQFNRRVICFECKGHKHISQKPSVIDDGKIIMDISL